MSRVEPALKLATEGKARDAADISILDVVGECLIRTDVEGVVLSWNRGAADLYGWSAAEALGQKFYDLVAPGDDTLETLPAVLLETGEWEGELTRRTKAGTDVDVHVRWVLRRDPEGRPMDIVGSARDIGARKKMEDRLRVSDNRYRKMFQAMAASFWELDFSAVATMLQGLHRQGVTDYPAHFRANPAFVREMMRSTHVVDVNAQTVSLFADEARREQLFQSVEPFWPIESGGVYVQSVAAALSGESVFSAETVLQTLDGRRFDALFTACFPAELAPQGKFLIGVVDISEQKRAQRALENSEARYRHVVEHLPVAFVSLDMTALGARFQEMGGAGINVAQKVAEDDAFLEEVLELVQIDEGNEGAVRIFGARDAEDLRRPIAFSWRETPQTVRRALLAKMAGEESYYEETRVNTLDGRLVDVLFTIAFPRVLTQRGRNIVGFLDISDRVRAQSALAQVEADLAHAARVAMLGELTASIAHEVNQPLAAIATNADTGLRWLNRPDPDHGELREIVTSIAQDARRAADVILRIRGMAVRSAPRRERLDLNELIGEVITFVGHETRFNSIAVQVRLASGEIDVSGDRVQLQQVLVNLVMNAVQAMEKDSIRGRVLRVESRQRADGGVEVAVEDNGPGLSAEIRDKVFDAFFTTKAKGLGLGLSICRSIIEAHGGRLDLAKGEGRGARFTFTLPSAGPDGLHPKV